MLFFISFSVFLPLLIIFFTNVNTLLLCLVTLELITFVLLWSVSLSFTAVGSSFLILIFCLFVLESVLGLVGLINIIHYSGSDYVSVKIVSCNQV